MRSDDRNMKTMKPHDRKMKTLDEERKEQAFYEATEKFFPIEMQDLIWERFLARCVCGRCGGVPTYNLTNVVETIDGPCNKAHVFSPKSSSAYSRALGMDSFHTALAKSSRRAAELYVLESASASPAFHQDNNA